jgi:pyruvate,water dikinase
MIENGFRSVVVDLGGDAGPSGREFVARFRGRAALNLSALRSVARSLPGGSAADVERQFLGKALSQEPNRRAPGGIRSFWRVRRAQRRLADEVDLVCGAANGIVALEVDLTRLPAWRIAGYRRVVRDLAWRATAADVAASSAATAAYRGLEMVLGRWLDETDAATWAQRLTAGTLGEHAAGARLDRELRTAYRRAAKVDPNVSFAVGGAPSTVPARLAEFGEAGEQLRVEVGAAARRSGSRSLYGGPGWEEEPELIWQRLQAVVVRSDRPATLASPSAALSELAEHLGLRRSWRTVRVLTGQIVDLRLRWAHRQAVAAVSMLALRERAKTSLLSLGGEEGRLIREVARRLVVSGQLGSVDDVRLLSDRELTEMLFGAPPPPEAETHWRRTVARRVRDAPPLPESFTGDPGAATAADDQIGSVLRGWAASPGRVAAEARIILELSDGGRLRAGDILVANATDASWTPVIGEAGGVVLETGGPLAHAAIVAREFGIPAVLNVAGATHLIDEGTSIEVDGYAGVVRCTADEEGAAV